MNVDEAIAYASKDKCFWAGEVHTALETLANEVRRLRAELADAREENKQLRLGWCKESEKRQDEWHSESAKIPVKIAAIGDTLCHHCNGVGQIETRIVYDMKTPYSVHGWAICHGCAGKGHL